jgi:catechol 2,3-dioxygenase-like lactoylglutathione lyase family enzyme
VGVIVEVMEESATLPGGIRRRHFDLDPAIVYITSSVSDADAARHYYERQIGLAIDPLEELHSEADERLWGLNHANRKGFVAKAGDAYLEVVQYTNPIGRSLPADYRLSDQGIMNVGLATENRSVLEAVIARLDAEGRGPPRIMSGPNFLGTYILDRERELELLACPKSIGEFLGFVPGPNFLGVPSNSSGSMVLDERNQGS